MTAAEQDTYSCPHKYSYTCEIGLFYVILRSRKLLEIWYSCDGMTGAYTWLAPKNCLKFNILIGFTDIFLKSKVYIQGQK